MVFGAISAIVLCVLLYSLATGTYVAGKLGGVIFGCVVLMTFIGFAVAMSRRGLYVGEEGVRIQNVLNSRTIPWAEVTGFAVLPAQAMGANTDNEALWIRTSNEKIETPIMRWRGFGAENSVGGRSKQGIKLSPEDFATVLTELGQRLAEQRK